MYNDLRYACRMLSKNPGFSAVVVLTLAVGIGGTTAIFSVLYNGILNPFPYADSHRLAVLVTRNLGTGSDGGWAWVSGRELLDYQEQNKVFDKVFGATGETVVMKRAERTDVLRSVPVTSNFFSILGMTTVIGRPLTLEDYKVGASPVAVLSFKSWRTYFGEDPAVVGSVFVMNDRPTTVIGVMPPRFDWGRADVWMPVVPSRDPAAGPSRPYTYSIVGHLKPGVSIKQANADLTVLIKRFAAAYPEEHPKEITFRIESLPIAAIGMSFRMMLFFLLGAVGLLLLIACGNVGNMLLARATEREKELAIRAALGASRARLLRQLVVESLLMATCGSVTGTLLAVHLLDGLLAIMPLGIPGEALVRINGPVLLFSLATTFLCTLVTGLTPALRLVGRNLQEPLTAASHRAGGGSHRNRLGSLLVASEIVVSIVLLSGAGLLLRSFIALHQVDLGYDPDQVFGGGTFLPETRYRTPEQRVQFQLEALRRVRALPGVVSAALSVPSAANHGARTAIEISGKPSADEQWALQSFYSDGCLETMRIPLLQGRSFSEEDVVRSRNVAIINQAFVNKYFGGVSPLGERVKVKEFLPWGGKVEVKNPWFEIVGVAKDVRGKGPEAPIVPQIYIPYTLGGISLVTLSVRSGADPSRLAKSIQQTIWSMDKELPVLFGPETARDGLRLAYFSQPRFVMTLSAAFASLGLLLVSVGVYSVLSYVVSQRTREIGIRMALGAQPNDVRQMVMASGLRWLAIGIGIGVPASVALAKILQSRIWGIKSADALTLIAVSLLMTGIGLAACYFPARRATKVDPLVALRYE